MHIFLGNIGRKNKVYSAEFKIGFIMDIHEHGLCYSKIVQKYWDIREGQEHHYQKQIQRWERIYLEEGAEGLIKERRGRGSKGISPKLDKKVEEDLIAENQRLRMEIEYLKKLSALVLAKEREKSKNQ